ncbi:MAG TPA: sugar kinase [Alphaproteobacteria bacterium]
MPQSVSPRIAAIGECMIELRHLAEDRLELAFGGDTFNTAVYLVRAGRARGFKVDYVTALGTDPYSAAMRAFFAREGVGTDLVGTRPDRLPGLYAIRTDAKGERTFYYWRREAAARAMFDGAAGDELAAALAGYDWLYLSGITVSILDEAGRARLLATLDRARARGGRVVFDSNHRPRNWPDPDAARRAYIEVLRRTDVALPTFGDEQMLFGDADPRATIARLHALGVGEIAVKNGSAPALASDGRAVLEIAATPVANVVDTTAAGDAFNGGYLAARIAGLPIAAAVEHGHATAGAVVQHRGAIIPADAMPAPV